MLHEFLNQNRSELIQRCRAKVSKRPAPRATAHEMEHGIPLFLGQLIEMLRNEQGHDSIDRRAASGPPHAGLLGGPPHAGLPGGPWGHLKRNVSSEIAATASKHGHELLTHGFSVDQVVHDYGDLCQAVTELAVERNVAVSAEEFRTLNKCLDDAIADAVTEFGWQRDRLISEKGNRAMSERLGFLAHEMRNFLNTGMLAFAAVKGGAVAPNGATSAVVDRSLDGLRGLIDRALAEVRLAANVKPQLELIAVDRFIAEIEVGGSLEARASGCEFSVTPVEPGVAIHADRHMLHSAVSNLLQNAFKFTRPCSHVSLKAYATEDQVLINVEDECGGLPAGKAEAMFLPFEQHGTDRSGLGLGLSISRRAVEASGGRLSVRDMPGLGCVFTIELPRHQIHRDELLKAG